MAYLQQDGVIVPEDSIGRHAISEPSDVVLEEEKINWDEEEVDVMFNGCKYLF